jgi:putative transposase
VIGVDWSPKQVQRQYRRRFGIESSYRCAGQVRGWTTSPNAAYRFVLIGLSFILVNVWLHVRWQCCQLARRGGRRLAETAFQLTRLVNFLRRALERLYGYVSVLEVAVPPRP